MSDHLIDISSYNPVTDWGAVARDGITGVSVKVSQATDYLNPLRSAQVNGARAHDVAPGGYHFGDHRYDARAQARFFVQQSAPLGLFDAGALAPMYDVENWTSSAGEIRWQSRAQISDHVNTWLDVLAEETDAKRALIYGSLSWWTSRMLVPADWQRDDIEVLNWVAVYNGRPGDLQGWSDPGDVLHQHTSDGIVPGIPGRVDKNITLRNRPTGSLLVGGAGKRGDDVSGVEVWTTPLKSGLGYTATAEEWVTETSARAERIEVQLAGLGGALTIAQTAILAAVGKIPDDKDVPWTDEQIASVSARVGAQLTATLPAAVVLAIGRGLIDRPASEVG